jgi:hypothetical protein
MIIEFENLKIGCSPTTTSFKGDYVSSKKILNDVSSQRFLLILIAQDIQMMTLAIIYSK